MLYIQAGENGDLVNIVCCNRSKGMFLDLQEKIKGLSLRLKEVENYTLMLSMLDGMLTETR
jgi:hypothetical protein